MNSKRFEAITRQYARLKIAIAGDFCLDRYLEIDPARREVSIETGLHVYNVQNVRSQPGGAGTILSNLVALGVKQIFPVGFCGEDGEGYELRRALAAKRGVKLDYFFATPDRKTFTYCKPLVLEPRKPPCELNRFDQKNWIKTPTPVSARIGQVVELVSAKVDGLILLSQVDVPETGVLTRAVLDKVSSVARKRRSLPILADSRTGFRNFPPLMLKMNADELKALSGSKTKGGISEMENAARRLSQRNQQPVFVTLAERGMMAAAPNGAICNVPALPVRGPIDIVGAGDAVTANLMAALAAEASISEAMELANAAASVVIHQLGTTGTASVQQLRKRIDVTGSVSLPAHSGRHRRWS